MPFGRGGTDQERHYLQVYDRIIRMPLQEAGFTCQRADEQSEFGPVPEQVITGLRTADLVVADLSGNNPNVLYELGFRHALDRPLVLIVDDPDKLPFNVRTLRTHRYSLTDVVLADDCRRQIRDFAIHVKAQLGERSSNVGSTEVSIRRLEDLISAGFTNLSQLVDDQADSRIESRLGEGITKLGQRMSILEGRVATAGTVMRQITELGLVSVHSNRLQAIDDEFFRVMQDETSGITIVGSTISGLRGSNRVRVADVLRLLSSKTADPGFNLRILLTHWDVISYRQEQEMNVKQLARVVISQELLDAAVALGKLGLQPYVKFYKGSPTCFTIVCEGQKLMLVNPYPYEREATSSWTVVWRDVAGGVYADFKESHVDQPWNNERLTVPMDAACEDAIRTQYEKDRREVTIPDQRPLGV
jgi:hypothetical protein